MKNPAGDASALPHHQEYGSGEITIPQMVRAGVWLNLLFIMLVTVLAFVLLPLTLGVELGVTPEWAVHSSE